jgi:hypothetical protein
MTLLFLPDVTVATFASYSLGTNVYTVNQWAFALYTSSHGPGSGDTLVTYTALECSLGGYGRQAWSPSAYVGGIVASQAVYAAPAVTFAFDPYGGGTTIYGCFLVMTDSNGGLWLMGASQFASSYPVPAGGGLYSLTPTFLEYSA